MLSSKMGRSSLAGALLWLACGLLFAQTRPSTLLSVIVHDTNDGPVAGVQVIASFEHGVQLTATTNELGIADIPLSSSGMCSITISKTSFQTQTETNVAVHSGEPIEVRFTLIPAIADRQQVSVSAGTESPTQEGGSAPTQLSGEDVKRLPLKPATVADALPLVPGVVRAPDGQIEIAGSNESQSAMLVNSLNVTDPQTGQFGISVPTDSVQSISVFKTSFLAQYGGFTAGVVSVETKRGGDKWHFDLEDPFPEFRIRSAHLVGLRNASPIVAFGGPIKKDRMFSFTSIQYVLDKKAVRTLQFPNNESRLQSLNLFTQTDYLLSPKHMLTATLHVAPQSSRYLNLDFFNPRPVTPNLGATDTTTSVLDRYSFNLGVLQSAFGFRTKDANTQPQGLADMILSPTGNSGNYFSSQDRNSVRYELREDFSFKPVAAHGDHQISAGVETSRTATSGRFFARPVDMVDANGTLLRRIEFRGGHPYATADLDVSSFVQDHWSLSKWLALDLGTRVEKQRLSDALRIAPRIGFAANLTGDLGTVLRGGVGLFYQTVPLSAYVFAGYPRQVITTFDSTGKIIDGPRSFANVIDYAGRPLLPFWRVGNQPGNFVPSSAAWNLEVEQPVGSHLKLRAGYLQSQSYGLLVVDPGKFRAKDAFLLSGTGKSQYRQIELTTAVKFKDRRTMFFSYVHSRSRGSLNQFGGYLGDLPYPVIQSGVFTNTAADVPNRFLTWGTIGLPLKLELAPTVEIRTGFPYAATDVLHQYVGIPNSDKSRFPKFFSFDARVSRDFAVNPKYGVRLSVTGLNLTDHFNALSVHSNVADPQFGTFFGTYPRRLRLDFDVLF